MVTAATAARSARNPRSPAYGVELDNVIVSVLP